MGVSFKPGRILKLRRGQEGSAVVEFALCLLPLLLIVGGILDYGQLWYMQSVLTTASREGARYATQYKTDPSNTSKRLAPSNLESGGYKSVEDYITDNYASLLPSDANLTVTPGGTGYNSTTSGLPVSVKVSAQKYWFILSYLIPGMTNPQPLTSTTVMSLE